MKLDQYPREILPCLGWKKGIKTSDVIDTCNEALLGHFFEGKIDNLIDSSLGEDFRQIRLEALPYKRIPNLSCCLLGAKFLPQHFHFLPNGEGKETWDENFEVSDELLTKDNFRYIEDIFVVGWTLSKLHHWPIIYQRSFDKKSNYDTFKKSSEELSKKRKIDQYIQEEWERMKRDSGTNLCTVTTIGESCVNHDPTKLNYWHFTIDMYPSDSENSVKDINKNWREGMAIRLGDYLRQSFVIINDPSSIPPITNKELWEKESA